MRFYNIKMEILADLVTQTLYPVVTDYLTLAEMMKLGIYVAPRKLHEMADAYLTTLETFENLAWTPEGRNIIHAKLLLDEIPMEISTDTDTDTNFYLNLNLSREVLKRYVKTALKLIPHTLETFMGLMGLMFENDIVRELILPSVIKYGVTQEMLFKGEHRKTGERIVSLALRSDTPKALKRLMRMGYKVKRDDLDIRSHRRGWTPRRTPAMIDFLVNELLSQPDFVKRWYTRKSFIEMTQDYFNQVLFRPDISMDTKTKIVEFMQQHSSY